MAGVLVLVLDTATPAVTAALAELPADAGLVLRAERVTVDGRAHGELLAPAIEAVLAEAGATPGDLAAIVAGTRPGPVHRAAGRPGHGRRDGRTRWESRPTGSAPWTPSRTAPPGPAARRHRRPPPGGLLGRVRRRAPPDRPVGGPAGGGRRRPPTVAAGDGADRYADVLGLPRGRRRSTRRRPRSRRSPPTGCVTHAPGEPLTPLYLRRPDAVPPGERKLALQ